MKYIANPVEVDAYKILEIRRADPESHGTSVYARLEDAPKTEALITPSMMSRYTPVAGDYLVIQQDGYVYLNPKEVFERKYRPA